MSTPRTPLAQIQSKREISVKSAWWARRLHYDEPMERQGPDPLGISPEPLVARFSSNGKREPCGYLHCVAHERVPWFGLPIDIGKIRQPRPDARDNATK